MKQLYYSLICEDIAHETFIKALLPLFLEQEGTVFFNQEFFKRFKSVNSKGVLKKYSDASIVAFRDYNIDLLLIGIDYDDRDRKYFEKEIELLYGKITEKIRNKNVIFFPVQAIEHWLMYIKYHDENPKSTKNVSFENISRKDAKTKVYEEAKTTEKDRERIVNDIVGKIDLKWLISRSNSFKRFNWDFVNFIQNFNK